MRKDSNNGKAIGAAYGTAKSGIGISGVGTFRPDLIMRVWLHYTDTTVLFRCTRI